MGKRRPTHTPSWRLQKVHVTATKPYHNNNNQGHGSERPRKLWKNAGWLLTFAEMAFLVKRLRLDGCRSVSVPDPQGFRGKV